MKQNRIALLCILFSLFMLLGCAKQAEATIPDGWIEYELQQVGMKIALPPQYVIAEKDGLTPTDEDYERAGVFGEDMDYDRKKMADSFALDRVVVVASMVDGRAQRGVVMMIRTYELPADLEEQFFDVNQDNVDLFHAYIAEKSTRNTALDSSFEMGANFLGRKHTFVTFGRPAWGYMSVYHGTYFEVLFGLDGEQPPGELEQIVFWLRVE